MGGTAPFLGRSDAGVVGVGGVDPALNAKRGRRTVIRDRDDQCRCVQELLLVYLRAANAPAWPGADGLTLNAVLDGYAQAAVEGLVPDLPSLRQLHPQLADMLTRFFAEMRTKANSRSDRSPGH